MFFKTSVTELCLQNCFYTLHLSWITFLKPSMTELYFPYWLLYIHTFTTVAIPSILLLYLPCCCYTFHTVAIPWICPGSCSWNLQLPSYTFQTVAIPSKLLLYLGFVLDHVLYHFRIHSQSRSLPFHLYRHQTEFSISLLSQSSFSFRQKDMRQSWS